MNELYHHGIKGQRWGRRRWQNDDGTFNEAGKKRYFGTDVAGAKKNLKEAKKAYKSLKSTDSYERRTKVQNAYRYAKEDLSSEKVKEKLNKETGNKSKHRLKLEQMYRDRGMSEEEAEIAAYKRVRAEKIIAASAALTVAAVAAKVAVNHYDNTVDKFINKDMMLQNISTTDNVDFDRSLYVAYKKSDKNKYRGLYGKALQERDKSQPVVNNAIRLKDSLKVASPKNAESIFEEYANNNPKFRSELKKHLNDYESDFDMAALFGNTTPKQNKVVKKGMESLKYNKYDKNVYNLFNLSLPESTGNTSLKKEFYDELTKHGYNGIMDLNDKKLSGYDSKSPVIMFNMGSKVSELKSSNLSSDDINKAFDKELVKAFVPQLTKKASTYAALVSGGKLFIDKMHKRDDQAFVNKYRKEHPDTKLTNSEILRIYNT